MDPLDALLRVEITDKDNASGRWLYAWEAREANYTTGDDQAPGAANTGSLTNSPAVEVNDVEVDIGTFVLLRRRGFVGGQMWFEFSATGTGGSAEVSGSAVYNTANITISSLSWFDAGASVTLPVAGDYEVTYTVHGSLSITAATASGWLIARLYDNTNATEVTNSRGFAGSCDDTNFSNQGTCTITVNYTAASGGEVLKPQVARAGGSTFTSSTIVATGGFATSIRYRKVG